MSSRTAVPEDGTAVPAPGVPLRRNRDFRLLWAGSGLSLLAGRAAFVAYPLLVLWTTGSGASAGVIAFALLLPHLLVQLPGGALVDRWDRRRIVLACAAGQVLVAAAVSGLLLTGRVWMPLLVAAAFAEGCLGVLGQLAERAAVPCLVPADQVAAALTGNEVRTRAASIAGQPAGSALLALGQAAPFGAAAFAHLASLLCFRGIRGRMQEPRSAPAEPLTVQVREGMRWLWRQPFLRAVMCAIAVSNVLFQGLNLAVMAAIQQDGGSAYGVGLVLACSGAGGLLGALSGGWWTVRVPLRGLLLGGLAVWTVLLVPLAVVRDPVLLGALFAVSGSVGGVLNVAGAVHLAKVAPDHLRGRANSLVTLVGSGAMAGGPVLAGFLLEATGPTATVLVFAAVMAVTTLVSLLSPGMRRHAPPPVPRRRRIGTR